jgi:hypothetical protein
MKNEKPQFVEDTLYRTLKELAKAYKLSTDTIYKRYQRGKRGDDLVPLKYRKNYVHTSTEAAKKVEAASEFIVGDRKYKNASDACRQLNIDYNTYSSRIRNGWTQEEALVIVPRVDKRTIPHKPRRRRQRNFDKLLVAFGREYKNYKEIEAVTGIKSNTIRERVSIYGKTLEEAVLMDGRNKKVKVGDVEYDSQAAFARAIGLTPNNFYQLRKKYTVEQIIGVEDRPTSRSILYRGKWYPNQIALAEDYGLTANQFYYRINVCKFSLDEALSIPADSSIVESLGDEGKFYMAEITGHHGNNGAKLYKIGVTQHSLQKRYREFPFECNTVFYEEGDLNYVKKLEKNIKNVYRDKRYDKFTATDFDGFTEVYQLNEKELNKIKFSVKFDILDLEPTAGELNMSVNV